MLRLGSSRHAAQSRPCWPSGHKPQRKETSWTIAPVPVGIFIAGKDPVGRKEESSAKPLKAIGIIIKIASGQKARTMSKS